MFYYTKSILIWSIYVKTWRNNGKEFYLQIMNNIVITTHQRTYEKP